MHGVRNRVLAFCAALVVAAGAAVVYGTLRYLGFPDGHLTDLDRALKMLGTVFVAASVALAGWFGYLGWIAARHDVSKKLWVSAVAYVIVVVIVLGIRVYLGQHLAHGRGG